MVQDSHRSPFASLLSEQQQARERRHQTLTSKPHTGGTRGRGQGPAGGCTRSGIGRCGHHGSCRETVPTGRPPALTAPKNTSNNARDGAVFLHLLCQPHLPRRSCTGFGNQLPNDSNRNLGRRSPRVIRTPCEHDNPPLNNPPRHGATAQKGDVLGGSIQCPRDEPPCYRFALENAFRWHCYSSRSMVILRAVKALTCNNQASRSR